MSPGIHRRVYYECEAEKENAEKTEQLVGKMVINAGKIAAKEQVEQELKKIIRHKK